VAGLVNALELGQRDVAGAMAGLVRPQQLPAISGGVVARGVGAQLATAGGGGATTVIFERGAIDARGATPGMEARIVAEIEKMFAQKGRRADTLIRGR